jgi:hypothetical protein
MLCLHEQRCGRGQGDSTFFFACLHALLQCCFNLHARRACYNGTATENSLLMVSSLRKASSSLEN